MLAVAGRPPDTAAWAIEMKWDGVRALALCKGESCRLYSRNRREITDSYPELAAALAESARGRVLILDGEVIAHTASGAPSFGLLQRRMHVMHPAAQRWATPSTEQPGAADSVRVRVPDGVATLCLVQPAEPAGKQMCHARGRAPTGVIDRRGVVGHRDRLLTGRTSLQHASLVIRSALTRVLVTEVGFDADDLVAEALERRCDLLLDVPDQLFAAVDVAVGVDQNLHVRIHSGRWQLLLGQRRMVFVIDSAAVACSSFTSVLTVIPDDHRTERSGSPNCWRKRYPGVSGSPAAIEFGTVLPSRRV